MATLYYPPQVNGIQKTLDAQLDTGVTASLTLNNTTNIQNKPGVIVINRIDSSGAEKDAADREFISYTGVSGNTLTGLTRNVDNGSSDQDHATGSVVEFIPDVIWAQAINDVIETEHGTDGTHGVITATSIDLGSSIAVTGVLDEDDMSSDSNVKLATQQSIKAYVDANASTDGWTEAGETWTYSAWDDTNGVSTATITVPTDATTKYQAGMRVKFDQTTDGTKYGIITKVAATELTVFLNTDYDFDNETITNPYFSTNKTPFGFDADPLKYTVKTTDTSNRNQSSPTSTTWYNLGSISHDVPVGSWVTSYSVNASAQETSTTTCDIEVTLSTANNSESDSELSTGIGLTTGASTNIPRLNLTIEKVLTLSAKDTYYLNARQLGGTTDTLFFRGDLIPTIIRSVCAYL